MTITRERLMTGYGPCYYLFMSFCRLNSDFEMHPNFPGFPNVNFFLPSEIMCLTTDLLYAQIDVLTFCVFVCASIG